MEGSEVINIRAKQRQQLQVLLAIVEGWRGEDALPHADFLRAEALVADLALSVSSEVERNQLRELEICIHEARRAQPAGPVRQEWSRALMNWQTLLD